MTCRTRLDCAVVCILIYIYMYFLCLIKAFARPPRAPWEKNPEGPLKPGKHDNEESYSKVQGSAGGKGLDICCMPGVSQEDTMEGPLWRGTLGRSLGSHDAAGTDDGMYHGDGCQQKVVCLHAISCTKARWSSLTHNRLLHQALPRPLRESKVQFVVKDT